MFLTKPLLSTLLAVLSTAALVSTLPACVIEDAPPRRLADAPDAPEGTPSAGAIGNDEPALPPSQGASPAPMLAVIDTDQVMSADPGQGVGIFSEYAAGGKWHIWWTCDTAKSQQDCDVSLSATATAGTLTNIDAAELEGGVVSSPTASRVEARVRTSTQVHGITFTATPGAVITLEATIGGLREGPGKNGSFFFFVQDGKINGGFTGRLTNPLQLQGSTP